MYKVKIYFKNGEVEVKEFKTLTDANYFVNDARYFANDFRAYEIYKSGKLIVRW